MQVKPIFQNMLDNATSEQREATLNILRASADVNHPEHAQAVCEFGTNVATPIRRGVLHGNNAMGIFNMQTLEPGVTAEYPLDILAPGCEDQFRAFSNPGKGKIPECTVGGDCIILPQYCIANCIDWYLKFAKNARWDIVSRALDIMIAGFVKKMNDDQWHTILAAVADRNRMIYDAAAAQGQFTRRLLGLAKCSMKRFGCGNAMSSGGGRITDVWLSCEAKEEIHNWGIDQVADIVRAELFRQCDNDSNTMNMCGVRLHEMWELGVGQEYQQYFLEKLGGSLVPEFAAAGKKAGHGHCDVELAIGLDLANRDSFVMSMCEPGIEIFRDPELHRRQKDGYYGWLQNVSVAVLDTRRVLGLSF